MFHSVNSNINAGNDINVVYHAAPQSSVLTRLKAILNPVPSASYDSYEAKKRSECFPNTRVQVLNDIETWFMLGGGQAPIYVLDGVAGIGKSTIAQTIAARAAKAGLLGASFFFSQDEDMRKVARHFFPTIAYQLARHEALFATRIGEALDKDPDLAEKRLYQQLSLLLIEPLKDVLPHRANPILIVVDALDECENEGAEELLSLLGQYTPKISGLKILITARPEWHLRQVLDQDQNHERFRLHDIEKSIVHSDISLYLNSRLSEDEIRKVFPYLRTPWKPTAHEMRMLCGICGTLFIIAATATKFILNPRSMPQKQLSYLLDGVSPEDFTGSKHNNILDDTYLRIIYAAQPDLNEVDENWFKDLNKLLGALITLANPLPSEALAWLLEMSPDHLEAVLSNLHSLVAPSGYGEYTTFRIHHKSFPDFITNRERIQRVICSWKSLPRPDFDSLLWIDVNDHHLKLAKACLIVMNRRLKWNMADIDETDWYKDKKDVNHITSSLITPELAYAVLHWASHLLSAGGIGSDVELQEYINIWASTRIMHWIEVLIILNQTDKIYSILQDAITSIKYTTGTAWSEREKIEILLYDTSRLVQQASEVMKISPMHIYRSCLPYIPTETALFRVFGSAAILQLRMERSTQWDPLLATCVGHSDSVNSVAYSTDGSCLASGSSDKTIRLWDAETGAHLQTLVGHKNSVFSVAFSNNGSKLLSGSADNTMWLWDVKTGAHLLTFTGHSSCVRSVAYLNDGSQLASGSDDQTIRLWDATTGLTIATLSGHSGGINAVAFSPDGSRLVSGSEDSTIRIWDAKTNVLIFTIAGHSKGVTSVEFSNDGAQIASGSWDKTVRLWDAMTGAQTHEFVGHSDMVWSVAFASDDSRLASGSDDRTIRLWDAKSGAHISTLAGHSSWVELVVFSNDGSRLVSGSGDNSIRLWDTSTWIHQSESSSAGHSAWVTSVAFSEDGSRLASGSADDDSTVRLWDAKTGIQIYVLTGHSDMINSIAFSSDGSRLVSGSDDKTIRLWDGETGCHILTLIGHEESVQSVAFSKDGSQLASGSSDNTIRVWDVMTGVQILTLTDHEDWVRSVAFSNDGLLLASGSRDTTVRIWDTKTGALMQSLTGHSDLVSSVVFSTDDSLLASQFDDRIIRLWDAETGTLRSILAGKDFSLAELISVVFLPCNGGKDCTSLLLLVRRETPRVTGLVRATLRSEGEWEIDPVCWFPPDMEACSLAFDKVEYRVAVGYGNGRVIIIDFSSERSGLLS